MNLQAGILRLNGSKERLSGLRTTPITRTLEDLSHPSLGMLKGQDDLIAIFVVVRHGLQQSLFYETHCIILHNREESVPVVLGWQIGMILWSHADTPDNSHTVSNQGRPVATRLVVSGINLHIGQLVLLDEGFQCSTLTLLVVEEEVKLERDKAECLLLLAKPVHLYEAAGPLFGVLALNPSVKDVTTLLTDS